MQPARKEVRRFISSELSTHGHWLMPRLVSKWPNRNEWGWANYLRALCDRNDCLFLAQDHSVALAEIVQVDNLSGWKSIWERFVWCENRQSIDHIEEAALFYDRFHDWGVALAIGKIVVAQNTDVPTEMIKKRIGRVWNEEIKYVNV
jgi:hypothetical protein